MTNRHIAAGNRTDFTKRSRYEGDYRNADEVEWAALTVGFAHISQGTRDEMIVDIATEDGEHNIPGDRYMTHEAADEGLQAAVLEIIEERRSLLGEASYPFELKNNSLTFRGDDQHPYGALLTLCLLPSVSKGNYTKAPIAFEYLSLIAARAYLGGRARGWRFGWPRDNAAHVKVSCAIAELQRRAGNEQDAWQWNPSPSLPKDPFPRDLKDVGMDFVAWLPWHDYGPGQLHLLGQCACGADWKLKKRDLSLSRLSDWMRLPKPEPVRSLFTPQHLALPTLREAAGEAGLIFDRIRIVQAIMNDPAAVRRAGRFSQRIVNLGRQAAKR